MMFGTQEDKPLAAEQVRSWWVNGGRWIFVGLPMLVLYSCWQFLMAVTLYFESKSDYMGVGPFDHGCMKSWLTLPIVSLVAFITIYVSFLSAGWSEEAYGLIPEDSSSSGSGSIMCRCYSR
ncbi:unnamed protein product [Prorocentrum cordatum]|uniref:Uncharacterized protein n=1 Tax=Prorocentrum cordatum TaxID=2364126 RepID=A0ABN9Q7U3_9DINO|nr:unnamed protein product [Polarella glacialis]